MTTYAGHTVESAVAVLRGCEYAVDLGRHNPGHVAVRPPRAEDWQWWPEQDVQAFAAYLERHPPYKER